jgi:outer membrane protein
MTRRILILAGLVMSLSLVTNAQNNPVINKKWSLVDCIKYALENNIQIKRQELTAKIAGNNYTQAKLNVLPSLGGQFNHTLSYGRSIDIATNQFLDQNNYSGSAGAGADLIVFSGFRNVNTILRQKYALSANELQVDKAKDDIMLNIASAYLQILFSQELLEVAKSQLEVTQQQVEKTKKLVEVGNKAMGDLMQIQAQASTEKSNVTTANNNLKFSFLILGQLLDMDSVTGFDIVVPENLEMNQSGVLQSVENVYSLAESNKPDVKLAQDMARMSEKDLAITKGSRYPTLSINGQIYTYYSQALIAAIPSTAYPGRSIADQFNGNISKQIALTLNIPIFNRYSIETSIANSKLNVLDAEFRVRQAKLDLYKAIQQAHADAIAAYDKYQSSIESVKSNEEAFTYAEQKYNVGMVSSVDYNIAKNNLTKAKSDLVQAKYEYIFKTRILDFYMGNEIKL